MCSRHGAQHNHCPHAVPSAARTQDRKRRRATSQRHPRHVHLGEMGSKSHLQAIPSTSSSFADRFAAPRTMASCIYLLPHIERRQRHGRRDVLPQLRRLL